MKKRQSISIDHEMLGQMRERAASNGVSLSSIYEKLTERYLAGKIKIPLKAELYGGRRLERRA
ncbi:MAG: hypothetical protein ABII06_04735 [Pseudomonadota bacterium]